MLRVVHVRYRGAFGLSFFWHHAVVLLHPPPADASDQELTVDPDAPDLGAFHVPSAVVVHWSAGASQTTGAEGAADALEDASIITYTWPQFVESGKSGNTFFNGIQVVPYPSEVQEVRIPLISFISIFRITSICIWTKDLEHNVDEP